MAQSSTGRSSRWLAPAVILLIAGLVAAFLVPVSAADEVMVALGATGCVLVLVMALQSVRQGRIAPADAEPAEAAPPEVVSPAPAAAARATSAHTRLLPDFAVERPGATAGAVGAATAPRRAGSRRSRPRSARTGRFVKAGGPPARVNGPVTDGALREAPAPTRPAAPEEAPSRDGGSRAESARDAAVAESCAIVCQRTGARAQFQAVASNGDDKAAWLAESPAFRLAPEGPVEPTGPALAAHAALIEHLARRGWEPTGAGEDWYEQRFRRVRVRGRSGTR